MATVESLFTMSTGYGVPSVPSEIDSKQIGTLDARASFTAASPIPPGKRLGAPPRLKSVPRNSKLVTLVSSNLGSWRLHVWVQTTTSPATRRLVARNFNFFSFLWGRDIGANYAHISVDCSYQKSLVRRGNNAFLDQQLDAVYREVLN